MCREVLRACWKTSSALKPAETQCMRYFAPEKRDPRHEHVFTYVHGVAVNWIFSFRIKFVGLEGHFGGRMK